MRTPAVLRKLSWAVRAFRTCENWREVGAAAAVGDGPVRLLLKDGTRLCAPRNGTVFSLIREIFLEGVYSPPALAIGPDDVLVDIGANIGVFTTYAARRTSNLVYALEPHPANVELLRRNLELNGIANVRVRAAAVTDRVGSARLFLSDSSGGHLLFDRNIKGTLRRSVEVPCTTLEELMQEPALERVDFLKLDCEGSEGAIFASTPPSCLARIRKIAMEFHDNVSRLDHGRLDSLLRDAGFTTAIRWDGSSAFGYLYAWR